jgi:hypothetical protein
MNLIGELFGYALIAAYLVFLITCIALLIHNKNTQK